MSADWPYRVTIAVPEAEIADANQLALVVGRVPADVDTFGYIWARDGANNRYSIVCHHATSTYQSRATSTLTAPDHAPDADLTAAGRAQALLDIGSVESPPVPASGSIAVILAANDVPDPLPAHMTALGLTFE